MVGEQAHKTSSIQPTYSPSKGNSLRVSHNSDGGSLDVVLFRNFGVLRSVNFNHDGNEIRVELLDLPHAFQIIGLGELPQLRPRRDVREVEVVLAEPGVRELPP